MIWWFARTHARNRNGVSDSPVWRKGEEGHILKDIAALLIGQNDPNHTLGVLVPEPEPEPTPLAFP
jgi:hypothetical protein